MATGGFTLESWWHGYARGKVVGERATFDKSGREHDVTIVFWASNSLPKCNFF